MRVCLGGTFHPFHVGHEALLAAAADGADLVFVGVTDGVLATRNRPIPSWESRAATLHRYWEQEGFTAELRTNALQTAGGPATTGDYNAIVVSPETMSGAKAINRLRASAGLAPLEVKRVDHVMADDLLPISATRITDGAIDRAGKRLRPVRVAVGSANPVKRRGVEAGVKRIFPDLEVEVQGFEVASEVPEQPRGAEMLRGAGARAAAAAAAWPEAEYAVGVEAGLMASPGTQDSSDWFDIQACIIRDASGQETKGFSPAFQYPDWVTARALDGDMISDILGPVADDPRIGGTTGAIGFLTDGRYDRTEFTTQAVMMAFTPRIRRALYDSSP